MSEYAMGRRTFLQAASAAAVGGATGIPAASAQQVPHSAGTEAPKLKLQAYADNFR